MRRQTCHAHSETGTLFGFSVVKVFRFRYAQEAETISSFLLQVGGYPPSHAHSETGTSFGFVAGNVFRLRYAREAASNFLAVWEDEQLVRFSRLAKSRHWPLWRGLVS